MLGSIFIKLQSCFEFRNIEVVYRINFLQTFAVWSTCISICHLRLWRYQRLPQKFRTAKKRTSNTHSRYCLMIHHREVRHKKTFCFGTSKFVVVVFVWVEISFRMGLNFNGIIKFDLSRWLNHIPYIGYVRFCGFAVIFCNGS